MYDAKKVAKYAVFMRFNANLAVNTVFILFDTIPLHTLFVTF